MSEEAKTEIGEWQASDDGSHIYSDDFRHDAMLVLSGNFGSVAKRKRCADQIAHDLSEITTLRAALDQAETRNKEHEQFRHQHRDCDAMGVENQHLRAALDQERAWSAKAEAMLRGIRKDNGYMRVSMMAPGIDALLSGRGEAS